MNKNQRSKKNKLALAIGATLLIAAGGWVFSSIKIANSFNSHLDDAVAKANQYVQNNKAIYIKPIFRVENVKTGFNTTEFTLVVEIKNENKLALERSVQYAEKKMKQASDSGYIETDLAAKKAELAAMPDSIQLFTVENIASHGPFPLITQFNFAPGISHIESTVKYNNLDPQFQKHLIEQLTADSQKIMQDHIYLTSDIFISFDSHMTSEMSIPAFNIGIQSEATTLAFGGFDLNFNIEPTAKTVLVQGALEKTKINSKKGEISFDGLDFTADINHANPILLPKINFNLKPVTIATPGKEPMKVNYNGLSYQYERKHNQENMTFDELMNLHSRSFNFDIHEDDFGNGLIVNKNLDISDIKLDLKATNLTQVMYEKYTDFFNWIEQAAQMSVTDPNYLAENSLDNQALITRKMLGLYRSITGDFTGTISPINIKFVTHFDGHETSNYSAELDTITLNMHRNGDTENEPLNLSWIANGLKVNGNDKQTRSVLNFNFKDINFTYALPTYHLYPIAITHQIGAFEYKQTNMPEFKFNDVVHKLNWQKEADSLIYAEHYQLGNLDMMGANFGSLMLKTKLSNINLAGITLLEESFSNALDNFEKKLAIQQTNHNKPELLDEILDLLESRLINIRSALYTNGITYQLSPLALQSEAGQATMNISFKTYPLNPELLYETSNPKILLTEILKNVEFNLNADINYLSDIAAKFSLLTELSNNMKIENSDVKSRQENFDMIINAYLTVPPVADFINIENNTLKSSIELRDKQINLNGTILQIDEFLATLSNQ